MKKIAGFSAISFLIFILLVSGCAFTPNQDREIGYLSAILFDGKLIEGFSKDINEYTIVLENGYPNELPEIIGVPEKPNHVVNVFYPDKLPGTIIISVVPNVQPGVEAIENIYRLTVIFAGG